MKHSWLVVSTPLKNMKVSWDDSSQYMEKSKIKNVPNNQPDKNLMHINENSFIVQSGEKDADQPDQHHTALDRPVLT